MIFVNLQGYEPNKEWLNRANKLTADLIAARNTAERKLIIDNNAALWLELKEAFCAIHRRKCWYSESKNDYSHCHIDHFRPKSNAIDEMGKDQGGYWWLTFNWRNYRYSAPAGNIRKRDYFHVLANKANGPTDSLEDEDILFLDPTDPSDPDKLKFDNEGKVISKSSDITSRNSRQAEYTIKG
ncbi:MAG: hypothetical protein IPO05_13535 [Flavobacteriales bacterium]|nr:hypothetical protein [Flavobacteriales bacterium]